LSASVPPVVGERTVVYIVELWDGSVREQRWEGRVR
jgi:hypothetical protein